MDGQHPMIILLIVYISKLNVVFFSENYIILFSRYPCLRTIRILLQCVADIDATNIERFTPLHIFVSSSAGCNEKILQLLCDANAHLDYGSESGERPIDMAFNTNIKQLLRAKMTLSLKCLCARLIRKDKVQFHGMILNSLAAFVQRH